MARAMRVAYDKVPVKNLGDVWFAVGPRGIWRVDVGCTEMDFVEQLIHSGVTVVKDRRATAETRRSLTEFFAGDRSSFQLKLDWSRVDGFTRKALQVAARIPHGQTMSYGEIAARAGCPGAARAAGTAMSKNPFPIFVPCHRVIKSDGSLGGYGGNPQHKRFLLKREGLDPEHLSVGAGSRHRSR
ncbi:MAG: methylated-DNA--[protein]-cysteine S-methyltransferase [candidate division Zixibacteria bacterium]|nr:methylated-DNA--[protein]-cysteine S-methyltransferase [candidate division Zixibacteria bacterium]